ncbi:polymorphic outer membrane protein repeat-containing protein, partial [Methanobrevibacter gottschalkii]
MRKNNYLVFLLIFSLFLTISSVSALNVDDNATIEDTNLNSMDVNFDISNGEFNSINIDKTFDTNIDADAGKDTNIEEKTISITNSNNSILSTKENNVKNNFKLNSGSLRAGNIIYISSDGTGDGLTSNNPTNWNDGYNNAQSGDTIMFLDGNYNIVNKNLNKNLVLEALNKGNAIINANSAGYVFFINRGNITINGLTFINGKNNNNGGAISFNSGNLIINNSRFINNSASSNGGAVYLRSGKLTIVNTTFANNSADTGGAAIADTISITHSDFINNTADGSGGAIRAYDNLTIVDSIFTNNTSINGQGGALYTPNVDINNSIFVNNTSLNGGGAIYSSNEYLINNSVFVNNSAIDGDGGAVSSYRTGNINNSNFTNNSAKKSGGAAYARESIEIDNSSFNKNYAGAGGAVRAQSEVNITNSNFTNNVANNEGGAIYSNGKIVVNNLTFINNSAIESDGGAIFSVEDVEVDNSNFINNYAGELGGAISAYNELTVNNSNFTNNNAKYYGGGVYANVLNSNRDNFVNNTAEYNGGGAYVFSNANINGSNFDSNTAVNGGGLFSTGNSSVNNSNFINNNAYDGSAIISGNLHLNNNNLENNTSRGYGIVYAENATIENNKFIDNDALEDKEIYVLNELSQSNNTLSPNQIENINANTVKVNTINGTTYLVDLEDGLKGYCLQRTLNFPDYVYLLNNLSLAHNQLTGEDVSEYLKILIYKYYFSDKKDNITYSLWDFTDSDFRNSNNNLTKKVIALYNSGFRVPDSNASLILDNGTQVLFDFYSAGSSTTQNLFLFNITYMGNNYDMKVEKITLNKSVINGNKTKFIIRVTNIGDTILHGVTVFEKEYDGLVYDSYIDEGNNWNYNNGKWIYKKQLNINESAEFTVVFKTIKSGNFTNIIISSSNETTNKTTNNTTTVYTPNLTVEKLSLNRTVYVGNQTVFTIVVRNTGDCDLGEVFVVEKAPEGLAYSSFKGTDWSYNNGKFTYGKTLKVGESVSFEIVFDAVSPGNWTNVVVAGSNLTDNKTGNNTTKVYNPGLKVEKITLDPVVSVGEITSFEIIVTNTGDCKLGDVFVHEDSYEGLRFHSFRGDMWKQKGDTF